MRKTFILGAVLSAMSVTFALAQDVTLSVDDIKFLQRIEKVDNMVSSMAKSAEGLNALNTVLSVAAQGPVKLALAWNKGAIEGWRKANTQLLKIKQMVVCQDIDMHLLETKNQQFFEQLKTARGCDSL